jgi:hypothetical protein
MYERQRDGEMNETTLFMDEERAKLRQMTLWIETVSDRTTNGDSMDRAKATIEFLQQRIEWLQTISRRAL